MTTVSGVSEVGYQSLMFTPTPTQYAISITFPGQPLPPPKRVGYFYVWLFEPSPTNQCQLLASGALYKPGIYRGITDAKLYPPFFVRLDAYFDVGGLGYQATII